MYGGILSAKFFEDDEDEVDDWGGIDTNTVFTLSLSIDSYPFHPDGKVTLRPLVLSMYEPSMGICLDIV